MNRKLYFFDDWRKHIRALIDHFKDGDDTPLTKEEIIEIIKERMEVGIERYGHGLRVEDDTRQWGTKQDSWVEMGLEEVLDNLIYVAAAMLRIENEKKALQAKIDELEKAAKELRQAQMKPQVESKTKWWHRFKI